MAPGMPTSGPYGAPAVTRDKQVTGSFWGQYGPPISLQYPGQDGAAIEAQPAPAAPKDQFPLDREAKQQRYEELLRERYDMYVRQYNADVKKAREAAERGESPDGWLDNAREDRRNANEMNRMWLESQKP